MSMRRYTRLTNAFSKKAQNLAAAVSLHYMYYNFARPHKTLGGSTPAMAASVASGSNRLLRTRVEASSIPSEKWLKPQE